MRYKILFFLFLSLFNFLYPEIEFEFVFDIEYDYDQLDLNNVYLRDIDGDSYDDILVILKGKQNYQDDGLILIYNQEGEEIYEININSSELDKFITAQIFSVLDQKYLVEIFQRIEGTPYDGTKFMDIEIYDFPEQNLIDSLSIEIGELTPYGTHSEGYDFSISDIKCLEYCGQYSIFIGLNKKYYIEGGSFHTYCYRTYLYKFIFENNSIQNTNIVSNCGDEMFFLENPQKIITVGDSLYEQYSQSGQHFSYDKFKHVYLIELSGQNLSEAVIFEQFGQGSVDGDEYGTTTDYSHYPTILLLLNENSLFQQSIQTYFHEIDNDYILDQFTAYDTQNFSVLWETNETELADFIFHHSTLVNVNSENHYVISFGRKIPPLTYAFEIRNILNGDAIYSQETNFLPEILLTSDNLNTFLFKDIYDFGLEVYQLEDSLTVSTEEGVITDYNNAIINFPNPFNPFTTIEFSIQNDSNVELSIFNIKGQKINTIANNEFTQGSHSVIWNGDDESERVVGSGVYLYKLKVNGKTEAVKKCLLLK
ncbi:MAG: T9SS type A sorting domain-containing protein [Candidatus Tenebribacter davisii]|jgi:hypothetical protein|nr:T9SS type A sorting domain-containing protein [Candidatus Tenebribacter davisii]